MSIIMPAGKDRFDWVPKDPNKNKMTKTASTEDATDATEEKDSNEALYSAAKKVVAEMGMGGGMGGGICPKCQNSPCNCPVAEKLEEIVEKNTDGEEVQEVGETGEVKEEVVEVEEAIEKVEEAVEDLKDAVGVETTPDEIEIDVDVEEPSDSETPEVPSEDELIVESTPEVESCEVTAATDKKEEKDGDKEEKDEEKVEAKSKVKMDRSASAEEFCKYAKISAANRSKIKDYWKNMLGYPSDYVDLMTKDWE